MDNLNRKLAEWKPPGVSPMDAGMSSIRRVAFIKRVHGVISAFAKAIIDQDVVSSLVFGDDFVHSCHFEVWKADPVSFLILQTYSMHGNVSYGGAYCVIGGVSGIVRQTQGYLSSVEIYLFSNLFQKYGIISF